MRKKLILSLALVLLLSLALVVVVSAQVGEGFDLSWHVSGGGGGKSTATGFELVGTMGQTAVSSSSGSDMVQSHGFWYDLIDMAYSMLPFTVKH